MGQKTLWVVTVTDRNGTKSERLVNDHKRQTALEFVATVRKATPFDVAQIMATGVEIEDASGEPV